MQVNADDLGKHFRDLLASPDWPLSLHYAVAKKSFFRWMCNRTRSTRAEQDSIGIHKERDPSIQRQPCHCIQQALGVGNSPKQL